MREKGLKKKDKIAATSTVSKGLITFTTPILATVLTAGCLYQAVAAFSLPTAFLPPMICGIFGAVAAYAIHELPKSKKQRLTAYACIVIAYIAVIIAANALLTDGIAAIINQIIDTWKQVHPYNYNIFRVESDENVCVCFALSMAAFAGGMAAAEYVRCPKLWTAAAVTAADIAILLVFAEINPASVMLVLVLKASLVWTLYAGANFGQLRIAVQRSGARSWLRASVVLLALFLIGNTLLPTDTELAEQISESCGKFISELRYGSNAADGLTDGDLTKAGKLERRTENVLKITMSEPQSYYLRGFVGESYENNRWKTLAEVNKESLYENGDLFYWLHDDDFYGQTQIVNAAGAAGNIFSDSSKADTNKLRAENLSASSKYLYLPYEMQSINILAEGQIGDANALAEGLRGERKYEFTAAENIIVKYQKIGSALQKQKQKENSAAKANTYLADEAAYNEFVYDNYLELPMDIAQYLAEKFGDFVIENGQNHFDYQMAKQNILFYLGKSVKYSEETEEAPEGIDFVLKFLDGSKAGYDVHYATAAVMMFRYYGIPARYVEGYLITKDDVKEMKADEPFYIDGTHAHAWVEYYQDGVGWLPFEVTPSYLSVMSKMETYRDISGMLGQTVGSKKAENQEEEQLSEPNDTKFEMFWIKHKVTIIFVATMLILALLIGLFVSWLLHERRKTAERKESFMSEDVAKGICNIHEYMMDVLRAVGLKAQNANPIAYVDFVAEICGAGLEKGSGLDFASDSENAAKASEVSDVRKTYENVEQIWQEARFGNNCMQEKQRQTILELNERIWKATWENAGILQKLKLKYVYFL